MTAPRLRVLIVEDNPSDVRLLVRELRQGGFDPDVAVVETEAAYLANLSADVDVVLCDDQVSGLNVPRALELLRERRLDVPFLIIAGSTDEKAAIDALQRGATDYLRKDRLGRLGPAVKSALERRALLRAEREARQALRTSEQHYHVLAESIPHLVWISGPDGSLDYLNDRMLAFTGWQASGVANWTWKAVIHADDFPRAQAMWDRARQSEAPQDVEIRIRRADGEYRWHIARKVSVRDAAGRVVRSLGTCTDIHEQKQNAERLARDAMLLASVQDSIVVTDLEGIILYWNEGATRLFGWTAAEMVGRNCADRFAEPLRPTIRQLISERAAGSEWNGEIEDVRKDGARIWIHARVGRIVDDSGRPIGIMGVSHDVTDRKRAEAERDQLLRQLRLQVERMPLAYMLFDANFRVMDWNASAERIFGYTRDEMLGEAPPFEKLVPLSSRAACAETLRRVRSGDMRAHPNGENLTKDGRTITCEWHNTPLFDHDGDFVGMMSLAQEVTTRLNAERALKLRDRAIEAVTQGILITDPAQPDNPIVYASSGFVKLTGYTSAEVTGRNCRFLQGKETDPVAVTQIREAVHEGHPCTVELLNYRKDGVPFWNELSIAPVVDDGKLTHFVGVLTDVTQRKHLEEQYRQSLKMEAIGRLAGGVAHDFNNLLTVINGYCDILLAEMSPVNPARTSVAEIHSAGLQAAGLTAQLLAFSRKAIVEPKILELNEVVEQIGMLLRRLIGADISLSMFLSAKLGRVRMNLGQIEQVIMNLAINARDAMPKGGWLSIETHDLLVQSDALPQFTGVAPGRYVQLKVADTGHGMTDAVKARIFEPFFTTKGLGKGTGLGMATVFGIVQQARGHISVDSEVGRGSTFTVLIPALLENPDARSAEGDAVPPRGIETVLLVEDQGSVRSFAQTVLRGCGYRVLVAGSGAEALRLVEGLAEPIHLLVTDVIMPVMGGRDLAETLRAARPELRVLYISGYTDDPVVLQHVHASANTFLQKPFTPEVLARAVRAILDEPVRAGPLSPSAESPPKAQRR